MASYIVTSIKTKTFCSAFTPSILVGMKTVRTIIGIDPGLRHTGWGIILQQDNRLSFLGAGRINPAANQPMAARLCQLSKELRQVVEEYNPDESAIEETFVNKKNPASALKLGQARGAAMLTLAQASLTVGEYAANKVKQSLTGYGHADKSQMVAMIGMLLPGSGDLSEDAADALAIAICHAHHTPHNSLTKAMQ